MFKKYNLSEKQIRGIACIVAHEQPHIIECLMAEASQIANLAELRFGGDPVRAVKSGWYAHGKSRYEAGTSDALAIKAVRLVFNSGIRTLPKYVNEHDCMSDIATVKNGLKNVKPYKTKWIPHKTVIRNRMSSKYIFYSFPGGYKTGVDPFGYTSKDNRTKYGDFCFTIEEALTANPVVSRLINDLSKYNTYIKENYKKFINKYDSDITTFDKAKTLVGKGKEVGITCVVPLRWALADMGIKNAKGKALISAPQGTFQAYYNGDVKTYLDRITSGKPIGMKVVEAIDKGLLNKGDIVCYKDHTHVSVYSGSGYKFYEGGSQCVKDGHYPKGILVDYKHYPYQISEILRWKGQKVAPKKEEPKTIVGNYTGKFPSLPTRGYYKVGDGYKAYPTYKEHIELLQKLVNWIMEGTSGYKKLTVDGKYGEKTKEAVMKVQKKFNIAEDGKFGNKTLTMCRQYVKK